MRKELQVHTSQSTLFIVSGAAAKMIRKLHTDNVSGVQKTKVSQNGKSLFLQDLTSTRG